LRAIVPILAALVVFGCGEEKKDPTGDDKREKAVKMALATPVHDRIAPAEGDEVDWKAFDVPVYETRATLRAFWDDPDSAVTVVIRDQFGGQMYRLDHEFRKRTETWGNIPVRKGQYYLEIRGKTGATVYTLEVLLDEGGPDALPESFPIPR
jgi:hypothetical protein